MTPSFIDLLIERRLDDALAQGVTGRPLIIRARRPDTVERLLNRASFGLQGFERVAVDTAGDTPQELLLASAAALAPVSNLRECVAAAELALCLFVADLRTLDASPWLTLAGAFASAREGQEEGPTLALITDGAQVPAGCHLLDDGDFVGPAEAAVFVRERRPKPTLLAACGDASAIEVSRGDLDQLEAMLTLPDRERFDPSAWIREQPISEARLVWRGQDEVCATWLARNNPKRLQQRVWRGQVSVMFPWLAEGLGNFLEQHRQKLPVNLEDPWTGNRIAPEDFEWSNILFVLNQRNATPFADCAYRLRMLRNALAHQQPLTWQLACRAEADLNTLLRWR